MTKIAVLSDVHGNVTALKAVLADAKAHGCEEYWFLGDLFLPGPGTEDLLALLDAVPITAYVGGNWESLLLRAIDGPIDAHDPGDVYFAILGDYIRQHVTVQTLTRLRQLPQVVTLTRQQLRFQLTHNSRTQNWGPALLPWADQAAFEELATSDADIMLYGHTHHQLLRQTRHGQLIINPGTVGMPFPNWEPFWTDLRAQYCILTLEAQPVPDVEFRHVAYDVTTEMAVATQRALPYLPLYQDQLEHGNVYTHDDAKLAEMTATLGYASRLTQILHNQD